MKDDIGKVIQKLDERVGLASCLPQCPPGKRQLVLHKEFVEYILKNHADAERFLREIP